MAYSRVVMGGGLSAGTALALAGGVATGISAAGTSAGTATQLAALGTQMIGTCASGAGVILAAGGPGDELILFNGGANQCLVYPPTGAKFNALAANAAFILPVNTNCQLDCVSATQWLVVMSA